MRSSSTSGEIGRGSSNNVHDQNQMHQKTIFLPMFCRVSIRDIKLNQYRNQYSSEADPSSPKVSCMGQVKRNNKVISFPTTYRFAANATINHHHQNNKYTKLKKLFSSKTLMPATTTTAAVTATSCRRSCRSSREISCVVDSRKSRIKDQQSVKQLNIDELDPPLPVVKRVQQPLATVDGGGRDEVNLWKRRFGRVALKSLQIEQIHLPNSNFLPPTTV